MSSDLRYPIGPFEEPAEIRPEDISRYIREIERLPAAMRQAVARSRVHDSRFVWTRSSRRSTGRAGGRCARWRTTCPTAI